MYLKRTFAVLVSLLLIISYQTCFPDDYFADGELVISHYNERSESFDVLVDTIEDSTNYKLLLSKGDEEIYFDVSVSTEPVTIPFSFGPGRYIVSLYRHIDGIYYQEVGSVVMSSDFEERNLWLISNVVIDYEHSLYLDLELEAIRKSGGCVNGDENPLETFKTITKYVNAHYIYDYIRIYERELENGQSIDETIRLKKGLCEDLSKLTVALLRKASVPARLVVGKTNGALHAWVEAFIGDEVYRFDPKLWQYANRNMTYRPERYY